MFCNNKISVATRNVLLLQWIYLAATRDFLLSPQYVPCCYKTILLTIIHLCYKKFLVTTRILLALARNCLSPQYISCCCNQILPTIGCYTFINQFLDDWHKETVGHIERLGSGLAKFRAYYNQWYSSQIHIKRLIVFFGAIQAHFWLCPILPIWSKSHDILHKCIFDLHSKGYALYLTNVYQMATYCLISLIWAVNCLKVATGV